MYLFYLIMEKKTVLLHEYSHEYIFVQLQNHINSTSMNKFLNLGRRVEDPASNKHIMVIIRHIKMHIFTPI